MKFSGLVDYRLDTPIDLRVQFEIHGFTALLGRSGAGKTSLLKALAGLLSAAGTPWAELAPEARPIGYLPQNAALFPHLSVLENIAYPLRGQNRFPRALLLLDELQLGSLSQRRVHTLSGGEAQRIALARALARPTELMLLDEPTGNLDAATRDATLTWLIDTLAARHIPALAATHDPHLAGFADWLVLLAGGRIIQQGRPRDVFEHPQSPAAATLLGFENVWRERGSFCAIRAKHVAIARTGRPGIVVSSREFGAGLRLECAIPSRILVDLTAGDTAAFPAGREIFLDFGPHLKRFDTD